MMSGGLAVLLLALAVHCAAALKADAPRVTVAVWQQGKKWSAIETDDEAVQGAAATCHWTDTIATIGMATLNCSSSPSLSDASQAYALGFAEGLATQLRITQHFTNLNEALLDGMPDGAWAATHKFFETHLSWTQQQIQANPNDDYWHAVNLVLQQSQGLVDGYNDALARHGRRQARAGLFGRKPLPKHLDGPLDLVSFLMYNSAGDFSDVVASLFPSLQTNCWEQSEKEAEQRVLRDDHCTALVKPIVVDGKPDVAFSHISWFDFRGMLRIVKTYSMSLAARPSYSVTQSGYPGLLSSFDDFYQLPDRGLAVTETTNDICNGTLYTFIKPQTLMTWERTLVANILAQDAPSWVQIVAKYNSGTYNNQFIVLDTRRVALSAGAAVLLKDSLWIIEQMPLAVQSQDVSGIVNSTGYWPSWNRPYFPSIYQGMGYAKSAAVLGDFFSYTRNPRANIFARDAGKVVDEASFKRFMQYNDWENDPLSVGNPYNAIAARADLVPAPHKWPSPWLDRRPDGGTDCKFTTARRVASRFDMISGPTYLQQPVFTWTKPEWANYSHVGHPDTFNFAWQQFSL